MNRLLLAVGVWLVGMTPPAIAAADNHTLDSLIAVGLRHNPELQAASARTESLRARLGVAGTLPDPSLSLAAVNLPSRSWSLSESPMSGLQVGLAQTIPWPGKLSAERRVAQQSHNIAEAEAYATAERLANQITSAYLEYVYWTRAIELTNRNLDLVDALARSTEVRYANGSVPAQDIFRSRTSVARWEVRRTTQRLMRQSALLQLGELIGGASPDTLLPATWPDRAPPTGEIEANPSLQAAHRQLDQARERIRLAAAQSYPDITVGLDYRFRRRLPNDPLDGEDFVTLRAALRTPLWFLNKHQSRRRAARRSAQAAEGRLQAISDHVNRRLEDTQAALASYDENLARYEQSILPPARAAAQAAQVAYEVGQVDLDAVLAAYSELLTLELEKLDLIKMRHALIAEWRELYGRAVEENPS